MYDYAEENGVVGCKTEVKGDIGNDMAMVPFGLPIINIIHTNSTSEKSTAHSAGLRDEMMKRMTRMLMAVGVFSSGLGLLGLL